MTLTPSPRFLLVLILSACCLISIATNTFAGPYLRITEFLSDLTSDMCEGDSKTTCKLGIDAELEITGLTGI